MTEMRVGRSSKVMKLGRNEELEVVFLARRENTGHLTNCAGKGMRVPVVEQGTW